MIEKTLNKNINVDLHIHSAASEYKDKGLVKNGTIANVPALLTKLDEHNINLMAFSDHNRFDAKLYSSTKELIESGHYVNLENIVPSVEFDVEIEAGKPSCHLLAIFDLENGNPTRIENSINNHLLTSRDQFYTREDFETLIKEIGLNVLLIACQRKSLSNPSGGKNCISDSVDDIEEFLKTGYISALEYQTSKVEGILNSVM